MMMSNLPSVLSLSVYLGPALYLYHLVAVHSLKRGLTDTPSVLDNTAITAGITNCPEIVAQLETACQGPSLSCRGQCGRVLNIMISKISKSVGCSCDAVCLVYGDCCHDYSEHCDDDSESFMWKHLSDARTVCKNGYVLIKSCPGDGDKDNYDQTSSGDFREPIVSEGGTNLHFLNRRAYDSCNHEARRLVNMTRWSKHFQQWAFESYIPDLRDFLLTGNVSKYLEPYLKDAPPKWLQTRPCQGYLKFNCPVFAQDKCAFFQNMSIVNLSSICRGIQQNRFTTDSKMSMNTSPSSTEVAVTNFTTTASVPMDTTTSTIVNGGYSSTVIPGFVVTSNECTIDISNAYIKDSSGESLMIFSLLVDFNEKLEVDRFSFKGLGTWEDIYCPEDLWASSNDYCQFGRKCMKGYISFDPKCFRPDTLSILTECSHKSLAIAIANHILKELLDLQLEIKLDFSHNDTYVTKSGGFGFIEKFDLPEYSLEHTGAPGLDIVKLLVHAFRARNEDDVLSWSGTLDISDFQHEIEADALSRTVNVTLCLSSHLYGKDVCDAVVTDGALVSHESRDSPYQGENEDEEISKPPVCGVQGSNHLHAVYRPTLYLFIVVISIE